MVTTSDLSGKAFEAQIYERLDRLEAALIHLARLRGARLTRAEMCERLG